MTYGILNSINKKDRLYKLLLKTDVISIFFFFKWEDTIKRITQVYLQQIRKKKYK